MLQSPFKIFPSKWTGEAIAEAQRSAHNARHYRPCTERERETSCGSKLVSSISADPFVRATCGARAPIDDSRNDERAATRGASSSSYEALILAAPPISARAPIRNSAKSQDTI